ncbi:MAG: hypothetical protein RL173_91 [Fibrobacterota bacterium]|jgi:DNA-binding LacI/PurR family transcriptional regulator
MEKRPLIGLLTNDLVGTYQYSFWSGMKAAATEEDCDLVSFNGGAIDSADQNKRMRNSCFELIDLSEFDALIVLSSIFNDISDLERITAFLDRFAPTPILTVGFTHPKHPSLLVDNRSGMTDLVEHLVVEHGRTRFAFLGGTASNPDSTERREALVETLSRHGLALSPQLEAEARFDFGLAREATKKLLDAGTPFDTLVAANDNMALGAMEALRERGKRIPDDVVVTGFDNIEDGLWVPPALTTIHQPVYEQGVNAIQLALARIDGHAVAATTRVSSVPVYRGSCGCTSDSMAAARRSIHHGRNWQGSKGAFGGREHLQATQIECESTLPSQRFSPFLKDLVDAIWSDCQAGEDTATRLRFQYLLDVAKTPTDSFDRWQILLSNLRTASLPFLPEDPSLSTAFEGLIHQLRILSHERALQQMGLQGLQTQQWAREVHTTGLLLSACSEVEQVVEVLAREATTLKITSLHLVLRGEEAVADTHRLHLSIHANTRRPPGDNDRNLSKQDIVRRIVHDRPFRCAFVVEPLFFGETQLGFAFLELVSRRGMLLDSLRGLISAAIIGTRLGDQLSHMNIFPEREDWDPRE